MVWILLFGLLRFLRSVPFLEPLWVGVKIGVLVLVPVAMYPLVTWAVLRFQLPPLSDVYIRKNWYLWIPGFLVACLPSLDILFWGKRLMGIILG
ncbi:hypothetical protein P0Y35_00520 [Kiritimatiellaeota bacterium B1221]|nr:hypothetical protein [Kiritimatiellaeota bacterium B1221]